MWRDRKENVVSRACGKGEGGGLLSDGFRVSVWDNEKVLEMVVMVSQQYNYT